MKIKILIPVYNDFQSLSKLIININSVISNLNAEFSIIIINDSSTEKAEIDISNFDKIHSIKILNMRENKGHARCIATGLKYIFEKEEFDFVIPMDGDGEDRPEEILKFLEFLNYDNSKPIVGERIKRSEGLIFTILYNFHKLITFIFTGHNMNFGHFTCLSKNDVNLISTKESLWLNFSGTVKKFVKHLEYIPCIRGKRYVQPSKMSFINLIIHSLSILAVFKYQVLFRSIFFLLILNLFSPSIITYIFQLLLIIFNILVFLISKRENSEEFRDCEKKIGSTESLYNSRL